MEEGGQITEGEKASGDRKAGGRRTECVRGGEIERERGDGLGREGRNGKEEPCVVHLQSV